MNLLHKRIALVSLSLIATLAAGCAAQRLHDAGISAFQRGEYEDGISKLTDALQRDPGNLVYRLDLRTRQESAVQKLLATADDAHANGRPQIAEASYRRVLVLEPGNDRAQRGLERIQSDRQHAERVTRAEAALAVRQFDVADMEVRAVLAEDPGYGPAVALATKIDQARGPVTVVPNLHSRDNHPVTLQFRDAPTKMVFEVLARQTGINFIFDKDVKTDGKTTIFVTQVPVDQAIDLILTQNQLARQILSDNMVMVYPNTPAKQKDYQDQIVHTFYLANALPKDAESMLKTVLGAKTLYIDERSNALTLRDTPEHVRMAERLIASLDEPEPEVIMEVEILEITHSLAEQLGINFPTSVEISPSAVGLAGATGGASGSLTVADLLHRQTENTLTVSSLKASVDLSKTVGNTNVLSSPRIRARNKEKAKILIGDRVPVVTSGTSATTGGSFSTSSVQYLEVGLSLEVQPTIHSDGNVAIKVALEVSSITQTLNVPIGNGGTTLAYQIGTRNANTLLELKDGETQVLAGLITDSDTRTSNHIPGLGDLPVLGRLFGSNGKKRDKSEIVLSITPHIIRAQARPASENSEFWYGSESQTRSAPFAASANGATKAATGGAATASPPVTGGGVSFGGGGGSGAASVLRAAPARIESVAAQPTPAATAAAAAAVEVVPAAAVEAAPVVTTSTAASDEKSATPVTGSGAPAIDAPPTSVPPRVQPDAKPKVTLEGPDNAKVGDEISVSVRLASGQPLGRVRAQVRFDAAALQLISAEPGDLAGAGDAPKVNLRPGGVQLELAGGTDAPLSGGGSVVDMRFRVVAARPALAIDTQVVMVSTEGVALAATAATPLKIAVTQ
jgi:general secretion pathway protein D